MHDLSYEGSDGHDEVDEQGNDDEQDSDCPENPCEDSRRTDLRTLVFGCCEVFRRRFVHIRFDIAFVSHAHYPSSEVFRRVEEP